MLLCAFAIVTLVRYMLCHNRSGPISSSHLYSLKRAKTWKHFVYVQPTKMANTLHIVSHYLCDRFVPAAVSASDIECVVAA